MHDASIPRYLISFHPKRVAHHFVDVLIIGGGLAGMRAALAIDPGHDVLLVTKDEVYQSNSNYAQGGIAGVLDPEDRFENHVTDTLTAGGTLCDPEVVDFVVREAPLRIGELIQWGTHFDLEEGNLALGREGGHSHHRIVHALGDATGREVMRVMVERVGTLANLSSWQHTVTIDLLTADGRAVIWIGQPVMRDTEFDERMEYLSSLYQSEASARAYVSFVDARRVFAGDDGRYADYLPAGDGSLTQMRLGDGIHLTRSGAERLVSQLLPLLPIETG